MRLAHGLLMMGPDCGTAAINGVGLCFANKVRPRPHRAGGGVRHRAAEVMVQIDRMGGGVSQAIGTGGRDLKEAVGGIMMLSGIKALAADEGTDVIVLVSKPPAESVSAKIFGLFGDARQAGGGVLFGRRHGHCGAEPRSCARQPLRCRRGRRGGIARRSGARVAGASELDEGMLGRSCRGPRQAECRPEEPARVLLRRHPVRRGRVLASQPAGRAAQQRGRIARARRR